MIRAYKNADLHSVMQIWLTANIQAHNFIPEVYWTSHYDMVKELLPKAELYVCENDTSQEIEGFIGLTGGHIAGIFVKEGAQSKGIGKQLLDHAKAVRSSLTLSVYQKNERALRFYLREQFSMQSEGMDEDTNEVEWTMAWAQGT